MAAGALVKVTQPELSIEEQIRNRAYELYLQREGETGSALQEIRRQLQDRGIEAEELLEPLAAAAADIRGSIVILRSPTVMRVDRVPAVKPVVRVGDYFDLRTVLTLAAAQKTFYMLALSQ